MSDMRATERLLEVIQDRAMNTAYHVANGSADIAGIASYDAAQIMEAITELRRRGDTLVRRDDLQLVLENIFLKGEGSDEWDRNYAALSRLENALGGKMQ